MISQIYLTNRSKFLETEIQDDNLQASILLGESEEWTKISDPNNSFTLGGSLENPISYTYENTGLTEFTINLCGAVLPPPEIYNNVSIYEILIDGDKKYYFYGGEEADKIINATIPVFATQGQVTNFKLTLHFNYLMVGNLVQYYFEGNPDTVYSSITAKFIPDSLAPPASLPIIYLLSPQALPTNTICVFTAGDYSYPLPTISAVNDVIELKMQGANSYTIMQGEGQRISASGIYTTVGTAGNMVCNGDGDWIRLICTVANKEWMEIGISGDSFILT